MLKFNELFEDVTKKGTKIPKSEYLEKGLYPIIDQGKDQIAGYANDARGIYTDVPVIVFGDHTRIVKYVDQPLYLGADGVKLIKSRVKDINAKYLYYYLCSKEIPNTGYNRHFKWLKELQFEICPKATQDKIVEVLDTVSNLIGLHERQIQRFDLLVKSRFMEMFGDPNNVLERAEYHVREVADVQVGIVIKPSRFYSPDCTGTPAFRSLNIGPMTVIDEDWIFFSKDGMQQNKKTIVHTNDVLIIRSGVYLGRSCVVTDKYDGYNAIDILIARPNVQRILPEYLSAFTNYPHGKNQIDMMQRGAGQKHLNVSQYSSMKLLIPSLEDQHTFVKLLRQVDKSKFRKP